MKTNVKTLAKYSLVTLLFMLLLIAVTFAANKPVNDKGADDNKVYTEVDKLPEFPGGVAAFGKFLAAKIHYPAADREAKVEGRVFVSFIIERDGSVTDVRAMKGPSKTEMEEAVRALKLSPKWTPGTVKNKVVRTAFTVPINFTLSKDDVTPAKNTAPLSTPHAEVVTATGEKVFTEVDKQPEFPGGITAFGRFLGKNVHYPAVMREKMLEGRVFVQFIVEADGSLSNVKALHGPGHGSSEEAIRVLNLSPKWSPGVVNGKPVRVAYTVPINFTLAKSTESPKKN